MSDQAKSTEATEALRQEILDDAGRKARRTVERAGKRAERGAARARENAEQHAAHLWCDDFEADAARIDLSEPMVTGTTVVGCEERRMDDPTKPFDRDAWTLAKRIELGDKVRPYEKPRSANETTLEAF